MATVTALKDIWDSDKLLASAGQDAEMSDEKASFHEKNGNVKIKPKTKELKFDEKK